MYFYSYSVVLHVYLYYKKNVPGARKLAAKKMSICSSSSSYYDFCFQFKQRRKFGITFQQIL